MDLGTVADWNFGVVAYWLGILAEIVIRAPWARRRRRLGAQRPRLSRREAVLLALLWLGMFVLPLIYTLTPWLAFADYRLPGWATWLGVGLLGLALAVFWRAHADLGANWSPTVELREGQTLVTRGIYGLIRHPMYASQWLWVLAQPLLLPNWLAGWLDLVLFIPFYLLRVPPEEAMMRAAFGEAYADYTRRVPALLPRPGALGSGNGET
jgi:protein-S-isoprenylcysteine O-methyltransferase Ste14